MTRLIPLSAVLAFSAGVAEAQNVTVQQPVFNNFSVGTTVSVPDGGGAYIGGVSRAGDSRRSFGPLRSGSSFGLFRDHSGVSTHVTIMDLGEMDRMILGQAGSSGYVPQLTGRAGNAFSALYARSLVESSSRETANGLSATTKTGSPVTRGDRSFRLGQAAEAEGKGKVAMLHYRMAARHGSELALAKLAELGDRSTIAAAGTAD